MGFSFLLLFLLASVTTTLALQCYQCGLYNDGVGSITPCLNETHMQLKPCPRLDQAYCIKYVSEGSTVRDCVPKCTEREDWGTRTFCCSEDGCNSGSITQTSLAVVSICSFLVAFIAH